MEWRDLERLPQATEGAWEARRIGGRLIRGKPAVDAAVARWNLLDPLMVSPPGSARFVPVLHVEEYCHRAHRALLKQHAVSFAILLGTALLLVVSGYVAERPKALRAALMAFAVALFVAVDYQVVLRRIEALRERALFILWVCRAGILHALLALGLMAVAGGLQLYVARRIGGQTPLLEAYGAVRAFVADEPWRIVAGPFLHGSLAHWLTNVAMLVAANAIAGPLMRGPRALALLLCGSTFGALVSLLVEATAPMDVYLGVSGGIFALFGWCVGAAIRRPALFPTGFAVTAAAFALLNLAAAPLGSANVSHAGHIGGLALGVLIGLAFPPRCRGTLG
ncbi:MAG TPA: rhomboid family intramembrane serine protease [Gammaproteobacteria bacterium]